MARAGAYYLYCDAFCWICNTETKRPLFVQSHDNDLGASQVGVPIHKACHRKKIFRNIGRGVFAFTAWALGIIIFESCVWNYLYAKKPIYAQFAMLPAWLLVLTFGWAVFVGLRTFLRAHSKYQKYIDQEIRLHTMPAD